MIAADYYPVKASSLMTAARYNIECQAGTISGDDLNQTVFVLPSKLMPHDLIKTTRAKAAKIKELSRDPGQHARVEHMLKELTL